MVVDLAAGGLNNPVFWRSVGHGRVFSQMVFDFVLTNQYWWHRAKLLADAQESR